MEHWWWRPITEAYILGVGQFFTVGIIFQRGTDIHKEETSVTPLVVAATSINVTGIVFSWEGSICDALGWPWPLLLSQ